MLVLDAHVHCGTTLPFEKVEKSWHEGLIDGGVLISPVEEIYDRYNRSFTDSPYYQASRREVHRYLESIKKENIYRLWFVWNDFELPRPGFAGVKWHRHAYEPVYDYASPACERFLQYVYEQRLPILLEEEFRNTLDFVRRVDQRTVIIIPHMGGLNGGYWSLKRAGIFDLPTVYVDTALATPDEILDFACVYGTDRIMFGSDFPFGDPAWERAKVERIFSGADLEKVLSGNAVRLFGTQEK